MFIVSMQYRASTNLTAQTLGLWAPISLRAWIYILCLCWPVYVEVFWWVDFPSKNFFQMSKIFIILKIVLNWIRPKGLVHKCWRRTIIQKIISIVCSPPVLSSPALVQLNHSVVLMKIIVLVKGKEAVLDTSVMQLEYHGYCLMSS